MQKPIDLSFDFTGTDYDVYNLYQFFAQGIINTNLRPERLHEERSLKLLVDEAYLARQIAADRLDEEAATIEVPFVVAVGYELMQELTQLALTQANDAGQRASISTTEVHLNLQSLTLYSGPLHGILSEIMAQDCVLFNSQIPEKHEGDQEYTQHQAFALLVLKGREEQHEEALQMSIAEDFYLYDAILMLYPEETTV